MSGYAGKDHFHPVHIIDEEGNLSPSAFIPFCEFGGNMTAMGLNTELFDVRVDDFVTTVVICSMIEILFYTIFFLHNHPLLEEYYCVQ